MTLSNKMIERFKNKPDQSMWNYIIALQQLQNALFELEKGENSKAIEYYKKALVIFSDLSAFRYELFTCNSIGNIYQNQGKYVEALQYFTTALEVQIWDFLTNN